MATETNEQTKSALQEVRDYLNECGVFYIATIDGDQPRVRPFGVAEIYNGKLYIQTGKKKDVFKQIEANPKFEITAFNPNAKGWIRVTGKLVNDDDRDVKVFLLDKHPSLKKMYSPDDGNTAALYITDGEAKFYSFTAPEKDVKF